MIQVASFPKTQILPASLQSLIHRIQGQIQLTPKTIRDCLLAANINPQDLLPWADFAHPMADCYGRNLVYDGGFFEIMVMSWRDRDYSAIHDHGATEWGAVQCFGPAEHYTYQLEEGILSTLEKCDFVPGEVKLVDRSLIHQMGNLSGECFLSLHVYGFNLPEGTITGNARLFDLWEGCIQHTDGGVFFGLPEAQINDRIYGLQGDRETTLRHHQQMRDRLLQILAVRSDSQLTLKLAALEKAIAFLK
ncbi:cysteine dioxygenase family protein [Spirulina sp. 06S082]|uniref:cysteine dioxygenase n=1 Tax=Spirulina sp. 06S082 TaxID=3110248 RepID=UPI002B1EBBF7|nr:cysteine dioxygenase family protein [Spirulina sp. 06S082]MEA5470488.1 cysteine dioxygenase family protein [Spirulina sp. 06S082]